MRISTFLRFVICWILLWLGIGGRGLQVWAQVNPRATHGILKPITPSTSLTLTGPTQICPGVAATFIARGPCGAWNWDTNGGTIATQNDVFETSSTVTISWPTAGTYTVTVYTDCLSPDIASKTVTVISTIPGTITTSGIASQVTATSATICRGNSLQLVPPAGSTNWTWNGANVTAVSSNGIATVQPVADYNVYTVSYTPSGTTCAVTSTFVVNVDSPPGEVILVGADKPGGLWRYGPGDYTFVVQNPNPAYTYSWYEDATSTTVLHTGPTYQAVNVTTQQRSFYVTATACQEGLRSGALLLLRQIELRSGGVVPAGPLRLAPGVPLVLQAYTLSNGPLTWFLNGLPITNQSGTTLTVTQSGRYTVRTQYPADLALYNQSQPVEVVTGLAGQTANGQNLTYLVDTQVLKAGVASTEDVVQLAQNERAQRITYLTGWAQPLQDVSVQAGPAQEDLVQHYAYAGSPTTTQTYLPFSAVRATPGLYETDPVARVNAYYAAQDNQPYATTTAEASPLARPISQAQAGSTWATHAAQMSYATNTTQDGVHRWQGLDGSALYGPGELTKETILDADGRRTEVYKDPLGRIVLQRKITGYGGGGPQNFDTYSVYAPVGYLQYVIPPAAVGALAAANTWTIGSMPAGFAGQWLYQYSYDDRSRLVERKFPGAATVYLVYDQFDRPVLVQDGNHRAANQWLFTKFDSQGRPVVAGLYYYNNQASTARQDLQNLADNTSLTTGFERRTNAGYSTNQTFPALQDGANGAVILSMTFFDDYDFDQDASANPDYTYTPQAALLGPQPVATTQLRGLQTMTRVRIVQPNGQYGDWLTTALFYDEYCNLIQKQSNNMLQTGSTLASATTLNYRERGFVPQVLNSLKTQQTPNLAGSFSPMVSVRNRFSYDGAGRLLQTWQQHQWKNQWEPEVLVSSNHYTGLGELTQKQLHSRDGASFLQKVDLAYDLHGQLKRINQSSADPADNPENDLFGLEIYREQTATMGNTPRYDGGISAVSWMAHNTAQTNQPERERSYRFSYDELGRLSSAFYAARNVNGISANSWNIEQGAYDERNIGYDANGNITALRRYAQATSSPTSKVLIDNLSFTYTGTGNQHSKIDDTGDINRGFKDVNTGASEYDYDANGSITRDANKNITYTYNSLNKVEKQVVGSNSLTYTYDAAGTLLKRQTTYRGNVAKTEYYVDGFVYQSTIDATGPVSVPTSEGRALVSTPTDQSLTYEYHLRDHLGNLRVAFRAQASPEDLRLSSEDPSQEEGPYPRFLNVSSTQSQGVPAYDGAFVAAMVRGQAGPSITIPVSQADRLKVRVHYTTPAGEQYFAPSNPPVSQATRVGLVVAPLLLPTAPAKREEAPRTVMGAQVSVTGLLSAFVSHHARTAQPPISSATLQNAYLRWTLRNAKGQIVGGGTKVASVTKGSTIGWDALDLTMADIDLSPLSTDESRNGTLQLEEVNDGGQAVYFDSLTVTHPQDYALVTQENHYYPMGMALSGVAVNTVPVADLSKQQFNEGSALQDELLGAEGGVYSTFYRTYDPVTGRFTGVDPLADVTPDWTPYQFAMGNPITENDPTGALSSFGGWDALLKAISQGEVDEGYYVNSSGGGGGFLNLTRTSDIFNIGGRVGYYNTVSFSDGRGGFEVRAFFQPLGTATINPKDGIDTGKAIDVQGFGSDLYGPIADNAKDLINSRGAYLPKKQGNALLGLSPKTVLPANQPVLIRTKLLGNVRTTGRALNVLKGVGTVMQAGARLGAAFQVYGDVQSRNYNSAIFRGGVAIAGEAATLIPYVGIPLSIAIGYFDYKYGDEVYGWAEREDIFHVRQFELVE